MSLIDRELTLDTRHVAKHLPDTPQSSQLLKCEGSAHLFNDETTMVMVTQAIMAQGEFTGVVRGHERYGLYFDRKTRRKPLALDMGISRQGFLNPVKRLCG